MIKAVIFDMDGILIDSEPIQMKAINQVTQRWGIRLKDEDFIPMIGRRLSDDFSHLKDTFHIPVDYTEFVKLKNTAYEGLICKEPVGEMPGVSRLLDELEKGGFYRAIASGSSRRDIDLVLKKLQLTGRFDVITSGDEVKSGKPEPEIYLLTADRLKISPGECLVLEDTNFGVRAAKSAGMKCIAIPHPYTQNQDFSMADIIIDSMERITISIFKQWDD